MSYCSGGASLPPPSLIVPARFCGCFVSLIRDRYPGSNDLNMDAGTGCFWCNTTSHVYFSFTGAIPEPYSIYWEETVCRSCWKLYLNRSADPSRENKRKAEPMIGISIMKTRLREYNYPIRPTASYSYRIDLIQSLKEFSDRKEEPYLLPTFFDAFQHYHYNNKSDVIGDIIISPDKECLQ